MREFFAPWPLAAVALLGWNDHLGKRLFHNWWTGKLSDIAGCFLLPLFLSALLSLITPLALRTRLALGAAFTLFFFSAIKLSPAAAALVAASLEPATRAFANRPSHLIADPTDLLALPFIALAVAYGLSRDSSPEPREAA